jgi:GDPmannose 4,6-dehydratase
MWLMLQQDQPQDYVIATGQVHSVRQFLEIAFSHVELDYMDYVEIDPGLFRPSEEYVLCGDAGNARRQLGWSYSCSFDELVREMVDADLENCERIKSYEYSRYGNI